ncbi:hypothetical protein F1529_16220 [Alcanivorax sp. VBW004]|jgi:hypothetical protein|uniref:DUF6164 family protein n=1 Tax=unclassified Alcanivorax TaxID=2638842 RepID=UPI0012BD755C|nr:DUF6164 family protein [Alcanivorax sp. VBW004]MTT54032.1 hypothetical protein [Alcanivorax sp. VBW004]
MTTLLLNLRQVPDDEAEEVRTLLNEQQIPFYETTPSLWGISSGGIWLTNPTDRERAKALMEDYQQQRTRRERERFEEAQRDGTAPTLGGRLRDQPGRALGVLIAVTILILVTLVPFLTLGEY